MSKSKEYLILVGLLILTAAVRCLHLLNKSHAMILNFDSYWFHWQAKQIACAPCANDIPILGSGIAYPMAFLGPDLGAILIPPLLAILTALVIYFTTRKMYGVEIALATVFCFSTAILSYLLTAAGAVDRDCLSLFLITLGMSAYYFAQTWKGALGVLAVMALIFIEWNWHGVALLGALITVAYLAEWYQTGHPQRKQVILTLLGAILLFLPLFSSDFTYAIQRVLNQDATEMKSMSIIDLYPYAFLLLPLLFASKLVWRRMSSADLFMLSWIGSSILIGLASARFSIYMVPAVCVVAGIGIINVKESIVLPKDSKVMILAVMTIMILMSAGFAWAMPTGITMSNDWEDALIWTKKNTPEDAVICSWWDYGYWIQDVAERKPLVNNGTHPTVTLIKIATIYAVEDDRLAFATLQGCEADYVIMSKREDRFWPHIVGTAQLKGVDRPNSLYERLYTGFESEYFELVYRNESVAILAPKAT